MWGSLWSIIKETVKAKCLFQCLWTQLSGLKSEKLAVPSQIHFESLFVCMCVGLISDFLYFCPFLFVPNCLSPAPVLSCLSFICRLLVSHDAPFSQVPCLGPTPLPLSPTLPSGLDTLIIDPPLLLPRQQDCPVLPFPCQKQLCPVLTA